MKKVLAICLTVVMIATMSCAILAANGGFVSSPSAAQAPKLVSVKGDGKLEISSYADRDALSPEAREAFEAAYNTIVNAKDVTALNGGIAALAEKAGAKASDLAVSDMFDISLAEGSGSFTVTLQTEAAKNFVCLLHYANGAWTIVEDAKIVDGRLEFTASDFSPFAIVVNTAAGNANAGSNQGGNTTTSTNNTPQTGDNSEFNMIGVYVAVMAVSAVAVVALVVWKKSKKQNV